MLRFFLFIPLTTLRGECFVLGYMCVCVCACECVFGDPAQQSLAHAPACALLLSHIPSVIDTFKKVKGLRVSKMSRLIQLVV